MVCFHRLPAAGPSRPPAGLRGRLGAHLRGRGVLPFGAVVLVLAALWFGVPRWRGWMSDALRASLFSCAEAWLALLLFMGLVGVVYGLFRLVLLRLGRNQERVLPLLALFLLLVLAANAAPIVFYIRWLDRLGLPPLLVAVLALLLANALLYFFFNRLFHMLWRELHTLYAVAAVYKGATPVGYAAEAVHWEVLNTLKPVFLYLLSFTLFTDYLLQQRRVHFSAETPEVSLGIIGQLFDTITHEGWTAEVWLSLLVLWAVVWPQRALLDVAARYWEHRHRVGAA